MTDTESRTLRVALTCPSCPEQYDVFRGEGKVGYLRMRHGFFVAEVPSCTVWYADIGEEGSPHPDGNLPASRREEFLRYACYAILTELRGEPSEPILVVEGVP